MPLLTDHPPNPATWPHGKSTSCTIKNRVIHHVRLPQNTYLAIVLTLFIDTMPNYTEDDIKNALVDIENGKFVRQAAREWGVPKTTLKDRLDGAEPKAQAHTYRQRLSKTQEEHLTQWVLSQGALGYAPTHAQIKSFASRVLQAGGDTQPLGKHWMQHFLKRNPAIKTLQGKKIEYLCVNRALTENIKGLFERLALPTVKVVLPGDRWNMDESGIMEGYGINGLVVGAVELKSICVKSPQDRNWTTIVESISADGRSLSPLVIFKGVNIQQQWFPNSELQDFAS